MHILINDGLSQNAIKDLEKNKHSVKNVRVAASQLESYIQKHNIEVLVVRSATKVTSTLLESSPSLKLIVRAGIGIDNINIATAKKLGIKVKNTPGIASRSVAELVMAHIYTGFRYLHDANRIMPLEGDSHFKQLKRAYEKANEIQNKTLGIIGFGKIGKEVAKLAYTNGMRVISIDRNKNDNILTIHFPNNQEIYFKVPLYSFNEVLLQSDVISIHTPALNNHLIGRDEIAKMKTGAGIINAARGGLLNEKAAIDALENEKLRFLALDTFENEPTPSIQTLMHPNISLSPHIGGTTIEAQERIGKKVVEIINNFKG